MLEAWKVLQKDQCTWADDLPVPANQDPEDPTYDNTLPPFVQPSFRKKWNDWVVARGLGVDENVYTDDAYLALRS